MYFKYISQWEVVNKEIEREKNSVEAKEYLKKKAAEYLRKIGETNNIELKREYFLLFTQYYCLYEENK